MKNLFVLTSLILLSVTSINAQLTVNLGNDKETCGNTNIGANSVSGGTPPYQYQWTSSVPGFSSTQSYVSVTSGDTTMYYLTVTDNAGQHAADTIRVIFNTRMEVDFPTTYDTLGCINNLHRFECDITGGVPPYTCKWNFQDGSGYDTSQNTEHMYTSTGYFEWQMDVRDSRACNYGIVGSEIHILQNCDVFHVSKQDMQCYNVCNGSASIIPQVPGTYRYIWSTGDTTSTLSGLCEGSYYVTVMDAQLNPIDTFGTIVSKPPSLGIGVVAVNVRCHGGQNGSTTVNVPGSGIAPFTYLWNNGKTTRFNFFVGAGNYIVTVTDANGCIETASGIVLEPDSALLVQIAATAETVVGACDGTLTTTATGGVPPYTYNWGAGVLTANRTNLCSGSYTVSVRDSYSCVVTATGIISCANNSVAFTLNSGDIDCTRTSDTITVNITSGVPPFTYVWNTGETDSSIITSQPGIYTAWVSDSSGCGTSATDTVKNLGLIIALQSATPVSCNSVLDGKIKVYVTGAVPPYTYSWSNGATTDSLVGLNSGTYSLTVTDAALCTASFSYLLNQTSTNWSYYVYASAVSSNCADNGEVTANVHGGTAPYTYIWNTTPPQTTQTASNLAAGQYQVTVTGSDGCIRTGHANVVLDCYNVIKGYVYEDANGNCVKDAGENAIPNINVSASNGTSTFYGLSDNSGLYSVNVSATGTYNMEYSVNNWGNCVPLNQCTTTGAVFTDLGDTARMNLALENTSDFNLSIHPGWTVANPGFTKHYWVCYNQTSTPTYTGPATIVFSYDSVLVYQSANNGGLHNPIAHTITWNVSSVPFPNWNWSTKPEAFFTVPANTPLGYALRQEFWISPTIDDCDTLNNHIFVTQPVAGSLDPNAKEVLPEGDIMEDDSILTYTIHFQNTGNDTTWFIVLRDTLSSGLDASTVMNISSSHAYSYFNVSGRGELTWVFDPIFLVDSATNEAASKGYVMFKVKKKRDLLPNTAIANTAYIYFDYNAAIVTNTVTSTIAVPTYIGTTTQHNNITVQAMPNPFSSVTQIVVEGTNDPFSFELFDAMGKSIRNISIPKGSSFWLDRQGVSAGIYFYRVTTNTKQETYGRLVVN